MKRARCTWGKSRYWWPGWKSACRKWNKIVDKNWNKSCDQAQADTDSKRPSPYSVRSKPQSISSRTIASISKTDPKTRKIDTTETTETTEKREKFVRWKNKEKSERWDNAERWKTRARQAQGTAGQSRTKNQSTNPSSNSARCVSAKSAWFDPYCLPLWYTTYNNSNYDAEIETRPPGDKAPVGVTGRKIGPIDQFPHQRGRPPAKGRKRLLWWSPQKSL